MKNIIFIIKNFLNNLARRIYSISLVLNLELTEHKHNIGKHSLFYKLKAIFNGYSTDLYTLYKSKGNKFYSNCISEFDYRYRINNINHEYGILMADKQLMYTYFKDYLQYFPTLYFYIENHKFINGNFDELILILKQEQTLIIKATRSYGGKGVHLLEYKNEYFYFDNTIFNENELKKLILSINGNYIITEYVKQHLYASNINPKSTNSMRIMTLYDSDTDECWIAGVVHRFGTDKSGFVDNLSSGGVSAIVDQSTGNIGLALINKDQKRYHPDTFQLIYGIHIHNWDLIKEKIIELAKYSSRIPYLGWDVVSTDNGFKILEINECADIHLIQYHIAPLEDDKNREFFKKYGVTQKK